MENKNSKVEETQSLNIADVISGYHNDSYLLGLKDAVEEISEEYEMCQLEFEGQEEKLKNIKFAFSRAIGLIEDRMIQHNSNIKMNELCDAFNRL